MTRKDLTKTFSRRKWAKKVFFSALLLAGTTGILLCMTSCTEYERNGINARPFNEPRSWEINPYGDTFRN